MTHPFEIKCPACGKVEVRNVTQAYVTIMPKDGRRPVTYEICSECLEDMYDLMTGKGEQRIEQMEHEDEHIPVSLWGHHE